MSSDFKSCNVPILVVTNKADGSLRRTYLNVSTLPLYLLLCCAIAVTVVINRESTYYEC